MHENIPDLYRVVVCGSRLPRAWPAEQQEALYWDIFARLRQLPPGTELIHGGARGVDELCGRAAGVLGLTVRVFRPDWTPGGVYDAGAGFARNKRMLAEWPNVVLAWWDQRSRGTKNTIDTAAAMKIPVEIVPITLKLPR